MSKLHKDKLNFAQKPTICFKGKKFSIMIAS